MKVGDLEAGIGTKKYGWIEVYSMPGYELKLPVAIINGLESGPTLLLTAGIHGYEYPGIEAVHTIINQTDPKKLRGAIIAVPIINVPGFKAGTYINPIDEINIHEVFPGKLDGSISYRIAHAITKKAIENSQYHIDFHSAAIPEKYATGYLRTGNKRQDEKSMILAKLWPTQYIMQFERVEDWEWTYKLGKSCWGQSSSMGHPTVLSHAGETKGVNEQAVNFHLNGASNMMKYLKMIEGAPSNRSRKQRVVSSPMIIRTKEAGYWHPNVQPGDVLSEGQIIGEIRKLNGELLEKIRTPTGGWIQMITFCPAVNAESLLACVWSQISDAP